MQEPKKGDIAVDEAGNVVLISRVNVQSEYLDSSGRGYIFHVGSYLKSNLAVVGSRWAGQTVRVVCSASDLLELAKDGGYDITTPAEKSDAELTEIQLLQRKVAQLEQALKQNQAPEVVPRPRTGIAALQPQK
jgi:hypothetical protein